MSAINMLRSRFLGGGQRISTQPPGGALRRHTVPHSRLLPAPVLCSASRSHRSSNAAGGGSHRSRPPPRQLRRSRAAAQVQQQQLAISPSTVSAEVTASSLVQLDKRQLTMQDVQRISAILATTGSNTHPNILDAVFASTEEESDASAAAAVEQQAGDSASSLLVAAPRAPLHTRRLESFRIADPEDVQVLAAPPGYAPVRVPIISVPGGRTVILTVEALQLQQQQQLEAAAAAAVTAGEDAPPGKAPEHTTNGMRKVTVQVHKPTQPGEEVILVGDAPVLGAWRVDAALPLKWSPGHLWTATLSVPESCVAIAYKAVLRCGRHGPLRWEAGANKTARLESSRVITLTHAFQ